MKKLILCGFLSALFFIQCTTDATDGLDLQNNTEFSTDLDLENRKRKDCTIQRKTVSGWSSLGDELNRVANCAPRLECDEGQIETTTVPSSGITGSQFFLQGYCGSPNCFECTDFPSQFTPQDQDQIIAQAQSIAMEYVKCRDYQINYNFDVLALACCPCSPGFISIYVSFEIVCCMNQLPDGFGVERK